MSVGYIPDTEWGRLTTSAWCMDGVAGMGVSDDEHTDQPISLSTYLRRSNCIIWKIGACSSTYI